jgi:hypothetical protein
MVNPYHDRHAHQHDWSLEPRIEVDEDVWLRFPCNYWEGETYTDDARDETYTARHYECEARRILVYELSFEVPARIPAERGTTLSEEPEIVEVDPMHGDYDTLVEAPDVAVEHVYTKCEDELVEAFEYTDPEDPIRGFSTDIAGIRVTVELRNEYVEEV